MKKRETEDEEAKGSMTQKEGWQMMKQKVERAKRIKNQELEKRGEIKDP